MTDRTPHLLPPVLRVLLVEDNPDHAELIQGYASLQPAGAYVTLITWTWVTTLADAFTAIAEADENGGTIDVVLLDLSLPDSAISDTLPRMVRRAEHLPTVVLTSLKDLDLAHSAVQRGAQDFLVKSELSSDLLVRTLHYAYERKRNAAELHRSNRELQQFASTLAHEIRSPLAGVAFCFDRLLHRYGETFDAKTSTLVSHGQSAVTDVMTLVEDLLSFARASTDRQRATLNTDALVDDVFAQIHHLPAFSDAVLTREPLPDIIADAEALPHLFRNLITNGLTYNDSSRPQVHLRGEKNAEGWVFRVEDNGVGIRPDDTHRIFNLFERADNKRYGSGIGLAFCKRIVERHGGRIWVDPQVSQGSHFCFTLPHPQDRTETPSP